MSEALLARRADAPGATAAALADRLRGLDRPAIAALLNADEAAVLPRLLTSAECASLAALYAEERKFRSRVVMAHHGFGQGEYRYFAYPLPGIVAELRENLYPPLAAIGNRWNELLRVAERYPARHADFLSLCHAAGQTRPTSLLLQYARATTTACTRISTARSSSRYRWPSCSPRPGAISPAASSFWWRIAHACSRARR